MYSGPSRFPAAFLADMTVENVSFAPESVVMEKKPAGLANINNSCYINSVIQVCLPLAGVTGHRWFIRFLNWSRESRLSPRRPSLEGASACCTRSVRSTDAWMPLRPSRCPWTYAKHVSLSISVMH